MERRKLKRGITSIAIVLLTVFAFLAPSYAEDVNLVSYEDVMQIYTTKPSDISMAVDVVIARPLLLAASAVGAALFIVSLPLSILGGNAEEAAQKLVVTPVKATFFRCLGCSMIDEYS